jgi:hypothetical protein
VAGDDGGDDDETEACVEEALTEEIVRTFFVTSLVEGVEAAQADPEVQAAFDAVFSSCVPTTTGGSPATTDD